MTSICQSKNVALATLKTNGSAVCHKVLQNRGGGAYLSDGTRSPNRGEQTRNLGSVAAIENFYQGS